MKTPFLLLLSACLLVGCSPPAPIVREGADGHWILETKIDFPSKIKVLAPDKKPLLVFEFYDMDRSDMAPAPRITVQNLSDQALSFSYRVLGYDDHDRRMSEGDDSAHIAPNESILLQLMATPNTLNLKNASSYRLVADIEH